MLQETKGCCQGGDEGCMGSVNMSNTVDFEEVARRKQASRDEDARALAANEKTREELRRENAILSPYGRPVLRSLIGAKPLR